MIRLSTNEKKIMKILALGDSFTYGGELEDRKNAWPIVLASKLNADINNFGKPGRGNTQIVRSVVEVAKSYDLVVIGWSSPGRVEFATPSGDFDVWPGWQGHAMDMYQPEFAKLITDSHDPKYLFKQFLINIIVVQNYLKAHNIRYLMTATQGQSEYYYKTFSGGCKNLLDQIDLTYFIEWPENGMAEWAFGTPKGPRNHFLEEGHERVANKFYEHIGNLGWLP